MIASLEMGGSQSMVMNIYRSIDRNKVQFDFIIDHTDKDDYKDEIKRLGGKIYILPTFKGKNIMEVCKAWNDFFKKHHEYKVIHTHSRSYASIYLPIAKKHGLITIAHSHSTSNGRGLTSIIKNAMQLPIRYQADYMFACSKKAGEWLFGKKAIGSKQFRVLPNAIDSYKFKYDLKKRDLIRKELGISNEFVLGHVGRLSTPKNHIFLLSIFSEYIKNNPDVRLLLIGDGELEQEIKAEAKKRKIENKIYFLGAKLNASDYYQAMDCFVFPSLWEGLGIAVIEAQAADLPVVCSNNVPQETKVTEIIKFISLDCPINVWCKEIQSFEGRIRQIDRTKEIRKAGYDITETSKWLEDFYLKISK